MEATQNSKLLQHLHALDEQEKHTASPYLSYPNSITLFNPNPQSHNHFSNLYPMFSSKEFNELKNAKPKYEYSFAPSEGSSGEHYVEKSESDSCSGDESDDEVSLDELMLHDGKAKRKIEQLAAMVGVDTTEPAVVLTEVVRVLKHLKRINC